MADSPEDAHRTLREQGREVMTEVLGAPYVARRDDSTNDFNARIEVTRSDEFGQLPGRTGVSDTAWGTREFHVRDADGNGLQFYRDL